MHNSAIEKRTALKLEQETEEQMQELSDMKQQRESQRALKSQELQRQTQANEEEMKRKQVLEAIDRDKLQFVAASEQKEESHRAELARAVDFAKAKANDEQAAMALD